MKYSYFTTYLTWHELDTELKAFGEQGWKLIHMEHNIASPDWFAIFIKVIPED